MLLLLQLVDCAAPQPLSRGLYDPSRATPKGAQTMGAGKAAQQTQKAPSPARSKGKSKVSWRARQGAVGGRYEAYDVVNREVHCFPMP